jgi:hypothetical protein
MDAIKTLPKIEATSIQMQRLQKLEMFERGTLLISFASLR